MIQPLINAIEAYNAIFYNLPFSIRMFVNLSLGLFLAKSLYSSLRGMK